MMKSAFTESSRISANVARSDEANTAAALTRATPIISAAAVADVRRGERPAFSWASLPGGPKTLATGQPISRVTGRATVDERLATPRKMSSAPRPARAISADGAAGAGEEAEQEQHGADHGDDRAEHEPAVRSPRTPAQVASPRPVGCGPPGSAGTMTDEHRDADADDGGDDHRPRQQHGRRVGEAGARGVEQGKEAPGDERCRRRCRATVATTAITRASM